MTETITIHPRLPIIGGYGGSVSTSQSGRSRRKASIDAVTKGVSAQRQTVFPRRRRVVDGVYSRYTCGVRVRDSVQANGRCRVSKQVWGSSCVSGARDTTPDDSSKSVLGKAASLQVGRIGHYRQHRQCKQPDRVWIQALRSRGAILVRPSIVLEEEVVVAVQGRCGTQGKAQALLKEVVLAEPHQTDTKESGSKESNSRTLDRVQGEAAMFSLRDATPRCNRLSPYHQGKQEVGK